MPVLHSCGDDRCLDAVAQSAERQHGLVARRGPRRARPRPRCGAAPSARAGSNVSPASAAGRRAPRDRPQQRVLAGGPRRRARRVRLRDDGSGAVGRRRASTAPRPRGHAGRRRSEQAVELAVAPRARRAAAAEHVTMLDGIPVVRPEVVVLQLCGSTYPPAGRERARQPVATAARVRPVVAADAGRARGVGPQRRRRDARAARRARRRLPPAGEQPRAARSRRSSSVPGLPRMRPPGRHRRRPVGRTGRLP